MNSHWIRDLGRAAMMLVLLTLLTGVLYPLVVTGIAQIVFPHQANGSLINRNGRFIGSELIGQDFHSPQYFWSRPSATTPVPYNAASSSGSNFGPLNPALQKEVTDRVAELKAADPGNSQPVPIDLATSSASGLDPHISVAAADYQADRVARARGIDPRVVHDLVAQHTQPRTLGLLGEPRVGVVELNLALDAMQK